MTVPRTLGDTNSWRISRVKSAEDFFRAVQPLVQGATHIFLEGAAAPDIVALVQPYADQCEYLAPVGTLWSWPGRNQRLTLKASPALLARLSEVAANHAEPEICTHLHFYREAEPLLQWFDAFDDPLLVSKAIPRETVERFCTEVGGILADTAR